MEDKISKAFLRIKQDLIQSQLEKNELKVSTLRLLLSEINNAKIAKGDRLTDEDVVKVVQKEVKRRIEAAAGFRQGGREDQAQKEEWEAKYLEYYLPAQMSDEELTKIVEESINIVGAKTLTDMGRVLGHILPKVGPLANPARVSIVVKDKLLALMGR